MRWAFDGTGKVFSKVVLIGHKRLLAVRKLQLFFSQAEVLPQYALPWQQPSRTRSSPQ